MTRIHDLLRTASADAVGWTAGSRDLRFAEMDAWSARIAADFLRRGVRRGDRIAVNGRTTPEWLAVYFAAAKIGAAVVGLSPRYRETEFAHILTDSGARLVVTEPSAGDVDFLTLLEKLDLPAVSVVTFAELGSAEPDEALAAASAAVEDDDPVMIIYTSGTTGRPKGATLTHRGQLASAAAEADHLQLSPADVLPVAVPLNHVSGITCCVLSALVAGSRTVLLPSFDAGAAADLFRTAGLTMWVGVPTMHTLLLNHERFASVDTSAIRVVVTGGANAEPALLQRLTAAFPKATVMNLYGLSEVSGAVVMTPWGASTEATERSIGVPFPSVEARIASPSGEALPVGETGELLFRTPSIMAGYHNLPTETAAAVDADGWLHTGDMARADEEGYLTLHGRAKDMFVQGGFNIYPIEVENVLAEHPGVLMAAGVGVPDPVLGEIGRYYVVPAQDSTVTEAELKEFCAGKVADYKVPRQIVLRPALPLTPSGKVQKAALRSEN
ncbi:class I adenylate-forming enzyme family protein [Amycolatopsis halotolerans]|uniref:Class I adenylate-forming enzyme family protein n=1 Tax=Amycolatopsis halotolerans TaxID=330083 RepID=A0ABV7QR64_9PSEU